MNNKPKIILVTGFLGSGKTTLINRLIDYYRSKKLAMIINDFGNIAVDGMLLSSLVENSESNESQIYEISNGSIFCSCLSAELVKGLKYYAEINPDVLLIETSGLSDPSTFGKILEDNKLDDIYDITASFCMVDSIKTMKLSNKIVAIEKQIISSDIIVVNKTDLISDDEYHELVEFIKNLDKTASILKTTYADIDLSIISTKQKTQYLPEAETCNTVSSRPGSIVLEQKEATADSLNGFYEIIKDKIIRIKGFLKIKGNTYFISDNNDKLQIHKFDKLVKHYGLSVLLPTDTIDFVEKNWEKTITTKLTEATNE